MTKINQTQAKEFLEKINEKDEIAIICHTDLDGFASGILFYDFCLNKNCKKIKIFPINYGISKISDFNMAGFNKLLIADLAPGIVSEDLFRIRDKEIFYTDHHQEEKDFPIPEEVLELRTTEQGYIPSSRTVYELCGGKYWLAIVGVISDFGEKYEMNKEFIDSYLKESGRSLEYLKKEVMYTISRTITYFEKHRETNFLDILKNIKSIEDITQLEKFERPVRKEFERLVEEFKNNFIEYGKIKFYHFEPEYNVKSFLITFLSTKEPEKIFIFTTPKNEELIGISSRNQSGEYDVAKIIQDCVKNLREGAGGGHKSAAGGHFAKEELERFKENLKEYELEKAKMKNE